jgi:hypothetical protein
MKPVMQTELGRRGNCFAACLASLFEVPLDEVPGFVEDASWWYQATDWVRDRLGFELVALSPSTSRARLSQQAWTPIGYAILSCGRGPSPLTNPHAVLTLDGVIIHNPEASIYPVADPVVLKWFILTPTRATFDAALARVSSCR